ncbi:unnamed protein product [Euphydryas editha]|uniref:Uncharacterized protein n=1 Tax=Euphydryas editha TaxID=104508 RepID=A0AAU9U489_EUPED|nr:unnamed protein product [Euphydryas editha]
MQVFNTRLNEFQKELRGSTLTTGPISNINEQFNSFRSFVLSTLDNLQRQVEFLSKKHDELEMRSRKKVLLLHGVPEINNEDTAARVIKLFTENLKLTQFTSDSFSRCHRLGRPNKNKPRVIPIKFRDLTLRNQVWSSKINFKGTGVTVSEFLTKKRHKIFLAARQRFGVTKCCTRDGVIIVLGDDGSKHRVLAMSELNAIPGSISSDIEAPNVYPNVEVIKPSKVITRIKRRMK